jgi:hypothetical protein
MNSLTSSRRAAQLVTLPVVVGEPEKVSVQGVLKRPVIGKEQGLKKEDAIVALTVPPEFCATTRSRVDVMQALTGEVP